MTTTRSWDIGEGSATITYNGTGDGTVMVSSDTNEGVDRKMYLSIQYGDNLTKSIIISQAGKRHTFDTTDEGSMFASTDGLFLVLKES